MKTVLLIITTFLVLQSTHSYILFTANVEDVQALAKQVATSPVADQLSKIFRRAAHQFQKELRRARRRGESDDEEETDEDRLTRRIVKNLVAFSKDMGYLGSVKRAFEVLDPKGRASDAY